ncbi:MULTISPECIES: amino acid ABC transporter substrate-binding protein [Marinobacter]|mgnify:FL=1|jgi:putative amino-acid transport system substrate-binding protein|uniref:Amino acid ABC transporter substrate-binding protein n=2 Tax=Marinobacter TaxID=2742 RepID=W5YP10_9GAMM|nr:MULTISPECIES: amino acid ABC transporter substrate-binding protein [Marinobacter]AHI30927.1 amino acid ABC transporter substrate-binding protein [Marinobacter salarius]ARM82176.1 putative amino-acid-binding protein YxeM [Marinobacter salarius]KXJ45741.1 MAG: amino acid ABC transporter substrate-binding protein [Marinobacter sp. Hex_13]MBJ7300139.1 amino acid ABC transporter substrate-binding protein [Marinobacter salarius]MBL84707.1 amino acid ABC transporter substrate-binding protein [Mari|tara:strand:+ start:6574 stop:7329 length:756 start_codon:yes stop_codon:yes gene_type:complete
MKTLLIHSLIIVSMMVSAPALAQGDPLRVGMSGQYFPFTFVEQDTLKGFEVDVMNAIGKEMGREIQYQTANFSGLFGMLESGRIDTVANQITITEERQKAYIFSEPYVYDGAQVVTKEGNTEVEGVEDLKGKTVAVNLGSNFEALLRELPYADQINIKTYESNLERDTALGRVDAFVMDRVSASQIIKEKPLPLELAGPTFSQITNAYPFRDTDAGRALRDEVNAALAALRDNGTLASISEKWFGTDITQP